MLRVDRLRWLFLMCCAMALPIGSLASTLVVTTCTDCGPTGGPALREAIQNANGPFEVAIGLVNTAMSFNPALIGNIDASVDKDVTISQSTPFTIMLANGFRPLVSQDGIVYILNPAITGAVIGSTIPVTSFTSGWGTIQCDPTNPSGCPNGQTSLTLSNFVQFSFLTGAFGTATPNPKDPVFFGLASITRINNTQIAGATVETDFANLNIIDGPLLVDANFSDLTNYQVFEFNSSTPEPSTLPLLGLGLVGLWWRARRKVDR